MIFWCLDIIIIIPPPHVFCFYLSYSSFSSSEGSIMEGRRKINVMCSSLMTFILYTHCLIICGVCGGPWQTRWHLEFMEAMAFSGTHNLMTIRAVYTGHM